MKREKGEIGLFFSSQIHNPIITNENKQLQFALLCNIPDSMEQIQCESSDGMVNAGIAMLQLHLH